MALDETSTTGTASYSTSWGLIIFFLILFWVFMGGFGGFGRANANGAETTDVVSMLQSEGAMGRVKNFDLEKQNAQNTAEITQAIHTMQDNVAAAITASNNSLAEQSRLQYDAQIGSQMFDLKLANLSQQQSYEAQLAAKDATIERMQLAENMTAQFNTLQQQIAAISANMLVKPNVTGVGAVCPNAGIINGLGVNSISGCGYSNGIA